MTQNVPEFQFDDDALKLRQFIYEYWCANGHGPNLRAAHEGTGLARERIIDAYKQLDLGVICVVDHDTPELQPAEGAAVLELPEPGRGVPGRHVPLLCRLRAWNRSPCRACRRSPARRSASSRTAPAA